MLVDATGISSSEAGARCERLSRRSLDFLSLAFRRPCLVLAAAASFLGDVSCLSTSRWPLEDTALDHARNHRPDERLRRPACEEREEDFWCVPSLCRPCSSVEDGALMARSRSEVSTECDQQGGKEGAARCWSASLPHFLCIVQLACTSRTAEVFCCMGVLLEV